MAVSAASLSVDVGADTSAAESAMSSIDARIQSLAGDHAPIVIDATVDQALTGIDSVDTAANDLASVAPTVLVDADAEAAFGNFDAVQAEVDALAAANVAVVVDADTTAAVDGLDTLVGDLTGIADTAVTAVVDADTDAAVSALQEVDDAAQSLDGMTPVVTVTADTEQAQANVEHFGESMEHLSKVASGLVLGEGILKAGELLLDLAKEAAAAEASQTRLKVAVDNTAGGWSKYGKDIQEAVEHGQKMAFGVVETRSALSTLTAITGNADTAIRRLSLAQDLARGTGLDLSTAARLLGKVTDESTNVLRRYGITVEAGATAQDLLNKVDAKFGGQAGAFAESSAGKMAIFSTKVEELKVALGEALLPALSAVMTAGSALVDFVQGIVTEFSPAKDIIEALAVGIGVGLVIALGALAVAAVAAAVAFTGLDVAALPWIALAAAIGIAVYELVKHWDDLTARFPILQRALDELKAEWTPFVNLLESGAKSLIQIIMNLADVWRAEFDAIVTIVMAFGTVFDDVIHGRFSQAKDDAVQGAKDIADAFVNMGQQVIGVFDGVSVSLDKSSSSYEQYKEPLDMFAASFDEAAVKAGMFGEATGTVGQSLQGMTQWIDNAAHSMDGYRSAADNAWAAQSALNDMLSAASGQVSFWQGNLTSAQGALKILNDQTAAGIPLSAKQSTEYDALTWAVGRYQGGVEDSQGAVVDAAAAQANFILIQDDLNGKLAAGTITQGEYNQQMAAATAVIDPATSSGYGLAAAQDTVAVAIEGVVNKLGNMLIDLGLLPESKRTEFNTPGLSEAVDNVHTLGEGIGALPQTFTIYALMDYTAFDAGINHIAGFTPTSPAKEGPLSKIPDWSFMTWTLGPTMEAAAQTVADGGANVIDAMSTVGTSAGMAYAGGVGTGLDDMLGPSSGLLDILTFQDILGPSSGLLKIMEGYGKSAAQSFVNGFATNIAGLSSDVLAKLKKLIPQLGDAAGNLVQEIVDAIGRGAVDMATAAALFTQPMIESLQSLEDNLTVQLAEAWLTGTDPGPIEAQLAIIHDLLGQATIDLLTTADAAGLFGSALLDVGSTAAGVTNDLSAVGSAATGAAGSIGEVGNAAAATNAYLAEMGGYLSDAAMQMGNVASGATSLHDALSGGLGGSGSAAGSGSGGNDLLGGTYNPASGSNSHFGIGGTEHLFPTYPHGNPGAVVPPAMDVIANSPFLQQLNQAGVDLSQFTGTLISDSGDITAAFQHYIEGIIKTGGDVMNDYILEIPKSMWGTVESWATANLDIIESLKATAGEIAAPFVAVSAMVQQADQLQAALADMTDGLIDSVQTFAALDTNLNNIIDASEVAAAKKQLATLVASLKTAGYNIANYLPPVPVLPPSSPLPIGGGPSITPTAGDCPPAVNLYLSAEDQTALTQWMGDKQAALAGMHSGLRGP